MKGRTRRGRSVCALSAGLAALLCALTAGPGPAYGAVGIETDRENCRIDFTLDANILGQAGEHGNLETVAPDYEQYYRELAEYLGGGTGSVPGESDNPGTGEGSGTVSTERAIHVNLYRIASVDAGGHFALLDDYKNVEALKGVESADSATTAEQWSVWAVEAAKIAVGEDGEQVLPAGGAKSADGEAQITLQGNTAAGRAEGLSVGLYLVSVEPVDTASYRYSFIPYLVSLPNNYYDGSGGSRAGDEWIYGDQEGKRIYVGLKPEREDRYGDLIIEKTIRSYDKTFEGAAFVFEITAVKDEAVVYNDVVSLTFGRHGTEEAKVEDIPAGAEVTVREVYSGASYSPVGGDRQTAVILARGDGETAKVSFENKHDGTFNGGNASVVNRFVYGKDENGAEKLEWEKVEGDSQAAGAAGSKDTGDKAGTPDGDTGTNGGN